MAVIQPTAAARLSRSQLAVFRCVETHLTTLGQAPTLTEIVAVAGITSRGRAQKLVRQLESLGYLRREYGAHRAIEIVNYPGRENVCPSCDHSLRPGANFCDSCGLPLQRAAA